MATLLTHVNNILALVGEQPLTNTTGNLGTLVKRSLQSALYTVVAETRHTSFLQQQVFAVVNTDYTTPAFALPNRCIQVKNVYWRSEESTPYRIIKLVPSTYDLLHRNWAYCIVGSNVFIGYKMSRPFTAVLEAYIAPTIEGAADGFVLDVKEELEIAIEATAAALVANSYIDDLAAQRSIEARAQNEVDQLRKRAGAMRAPISWRSN